MSVPRVAVESARAATSASRIRTAPTAAAASARTRSSSATNPCTSGTTSSGRDPFFDAPDVFASFDDGSGVADYYPQQRLFRETLEMHPQYVLENGVDFAHFKFVHQTPIVPVFTRHDFDDDRSPTSTSRSPSKATTTRASTTSRAASKRSTGVWASP